MSGTLHTTETDHSLAPSRRGEPTWELALKYPRQGEWTEDDYDRVQQDAFVELVNGCLEFLPMPDLSHQLLVRFLFLRLYQLVESQKSGEVLFAPLPVRLWPARILEPDLFYVSPASLKRTSSGLAAIDLAVEVVSPGADARERDFVNKREDYAQAGVAEYWIVDPDDRSVRVLVLENSTYREHGPFRGDAIAESRLLPGFQINVTELFAAAESP